MIDGSLEHTDGVLNLRTIKKLRGAKRNKGHVRPYWKTEVEAVQTSKHVARAQLAERKPRFYFFRVSGN